MNGATQRPQRLEDYLEALTLRLQLLDLPRVRIGQVVAEVRAHVHDSGEDPRTAFGAPADYADAVAVAEADGQARPDPWTGWGWMVRFTAFVAGAYLLRMFALNSQSWSDFTTLPWPLIVYLLALGAVGAMVSRWLIRPWAARQGVYAPTLSVAIAPRALVLGGLATVIVGPAVLPFQIQTFIELAPGAPATVWIGVGVALVGGAIITEIRASRPPRPD